MVAEGGCEAVRDDMMPVGHGAGCCLGRWVVSVLTAGPSGLGLCGGEAQGRHVPHSLLWGLCGETGSSGERGLKPLCQAWCFVYTGKFNHSLNLQAGRLKCGGGYV